jgi:hypothetical protein
VYHVNHGTTPGVRDEAGDRVARGRGGVLGSSPGAASLAGRGDA